MSTPILTWFVFTSASPCEAAIHVGVDNDVADPPVAADHTDGVIDDDHDVDPHSMEVDNHVISKVCIYFYVLPIL